MRGVVGPGRPLVIGLSVWFLCLPIWVGVQLLSAAIGGGLNDPDTGEASWQAFGIGLGLSVTPWLILGAKIVQWWRSGREGLWRPPLAWLLLLLPYFWPALLFPRVRRWAPPGNCAANPSCGVAVRIGG